MLKIVVVSTAVTVGVLMAIGHGPAAVRKVFGF